MAMNLKELAAELGLSQTTVSRALNGYPEVSEKTREKVLAAADRLGYRPSPAAQRLATGRAHAIGVVFPFDSNANFDPHFVEYLSGVAETCAAHGFDILICPSASRDQLATYRRLARFGTVDALLVNRPSRDDERMALLGELGFPFVVHGRPPVPAGVSYVDIDNLDAFHQAARFLLQLGHRNIALINGELQYNFAHDRLEGARRAFVEAGLDPADLRSASAPMTVENGYRLALELLSDSERPTALLCSSVLVALGALRAAAECGLDVPRDLSLVAHDDEMPAFRADHMHPPLTTTRSSIRAAGVRVAEIALQRLADRDGPPVAETWPVQLVVRGSTAAVPARLVQIVKKA